MEFFQVHSEREDIKFDVYTTNCRNVAYQFEMWDVVEQIDLKNGELWPFIHPKSREPRIKRPLEEKLRERGEWIEEEEEEEEEEYSEEEEEDNEEEEREEGNDAEPKKRKRRVKKKREERKDEEEENTGKQNANGMYWKCLNFRFEIDIIRLMSLVG